MAIDPNLVTTVRTGELPPLPLELESKIAHEIGDVLYRTDIQDLVNFIRANSISYPYEKKDIIAPNPEYITDNFDMTPGATEGLGLVGGLWEGWAICNGNNGTPNLDGQTLIGYGANYPTVGQFLGSKDAVLVEHGHGLASRSWTTNNTDGLPESDVIAGRSLSRTGYTELGTSSQPLVEVVGEDGTDKNIQPSMVILMIMKLP